MTKRLTACRIQLVTPAQAKRWLDAAAAAGSINRHISHKMVAFLEEELRSKRWQVSNDAIVINPAGVPLNGQHRLTAVYQSGIAAQFVVLEGVEDEAREIMDLGRGRSVSDAMTMMAGVRRARLVTGAIAMIDSKVNDRTLKVSFGRAMEMYDMFKAGFDWAIEAVPGKSFFCSSPVVAALVFAHATNPQMVQDFATRLFMGTDLAIESPILALRNYIMKQGGGGHARDEKELTFDLVLTFARRHIVRSTSKKIRADKDAVAYFAKANKQQPAATVQRAA